jgi:lipoprotein-releasing system permease protein
MFRPFSAFVGLRYVRAKRRNHFISFISLSSVLGVTVGVTALITVLSVMNGFDRVMTERTLDMVAHATVEKTTGQFSDWETVAAALDRHPEVDGVAPYFTAEAMLSVADRSSGVRVQGVAPGYEDRVSRISSKLLIGDLQSLRPGAYGIIIGKELAEQLGAFAGAKATLVVTAASSTPFGVMQRSKRFTVIGVFEAGMHEFDSALALINLADAEKLFRAPAPTGLRIKTADVMRAAAITRAALGAAPGEYSIVDWTERNRNLYRALKTEKVAMFIILALIVAVAAFNIVSTLVMMVVDKQADIAVLMTLGARPSSIMRIFIIQGVIIGALGLGMGNVFGVWLSTNIDALMKGFESVTGVDVLPCDVFYVCEFPSALLWSDVVNISLVTFLLCLTATLYPAWRAARTRPVEALRYE